MGLLNVLLPSKIPVRSPFRRPFEPRNLTHKSTSLHSLHTPLKNSPPPGGWSTLSWPYRARGSSLYPIVDPSQSHLSLCLRRRAKTLRIIWGVVLGETTLCGRRIDSSVSGLLWGGWMSLNTFGKRSSQPEVDQAT